MTGDFKKMKLSANVCAMLSAEFVNTSCGPLYCKIKEMVSKPFMLFFYKKKKLRAWIILNFIWVISKVT